MQCPDVIAYGYTLYNIYPTEYTDPQQDNEASSVLPLNATQEQLSHLSGYVTTVPISTRVPFAKAHCSPKEGSGAERNGKDYNTVDNNGTSPDINHLNI